MSRGRRIAVIVGGAAVAGAVVAVGWLGFAGIERTVVAGTQSRICGTMVGVSSVEPGRSVRVLGPSDATLAVGDRARVHALCVVEVVGIEGQHAEGADVDRADVDGADVDGADVEGAAERVRLRWRLW